jgi:hypothetical protein
MLCYEAFMEGLVSETLIDISAGKRRHRRRAPSPEIDRRAEAPFNGDTATRLVADPYPTTGGKIAVTASLRDDPLGQLFARRQIDEAQYRPGRMVEEWLELSEIGSVQAIDPAKEAVDGRGQYVEAITDKQIHAMRRLAHVRNVLGQVGYDLCRSVIAEGATMERVAAQSGTASKHAREWWGKRFRECLQTLAVALGVTGKRSHSPNDRYTELAIKHQES